MTQTTDSIGTAWTCSSEGAFLPLRYAMTAFPHNAAETYF